MTALSVANCSCTDVGSPPDPYVTFGTMAMEATTPYCSDTVACSLDPTSITVKAADLLAGTVSVSFYDDDSPLKPDYCGGATLKVTSPIPIQAQYTVKSGSGPDLFTYSLKAK
jgi:hypothetical protein